MASKPLKIQTTIMFDAFDFKAFLRGIIDIELNSPEFIFPIQVDTGNTDGYGKSDYFWCNRCLSVLRAPSRRVTCPSCKASLDDRSKEPEVTRTIRLALTGEEKVVRKAAEKVKALLFGNPCLLESCGAVLDDIHCEDRFCFHVS